MMKAGAGTMDLKEGSREGNNGGETDLAHVRTLRIGVLARGHLQHGHAKRVNVHALAVPGPVGLSPTRAHLRGHVLGSANDACGMVPVLASDRITSRGQTFISRRKRIQQHHRGPAAKKTTREPVNVRGVAMVIWAQVVAQAGCGPGSVMGHPKHLTERNEAEQSIIEVNFDDRGHQSIRCLKKVCHVCHYIRLLMLGLRRKGTAICSQQERSLSRKLSWEG
jgi:hypothetical protein